MAHGRPRDWRREQQWRQWIQRWQRSGLSVSAFCDRHGLASPSFYAWRRTLAQRDVEAVRFAPVQVAADEHATENTRADSGKGLELVLPTGQFLRIGPDFDGPTLQRLLSLLEGGQP